MYFNSNFQFSIKRTERAEAIISSLKNILFGLPGIITRSLVKAGYLFIFNDLLYLDSVEQLNEITYTLGNPGCFVNTGDFNNRGTEKSRHRITLGLPVKDIF